mgnify:CR=1 FL=1
MAAVVVEFVGELISTPLVELVVVVLRMYRGDGSSTVRNTAFGVGQQLGADTCLLYTSDAADE